MAKWKRASEVALAAALFAGIATVGLAQAPADEVAARQAAMKVVGKGNAAIAAAMKAETPDFPGANAAAKSIQSAFTAFPGHFVAGSGPDSGITTKAKAEIWTDMEGFKAANMKAVTASAALVAATAGTDVAAVNAAQTELRGTCGGCHSKYRS